MSDVNARIQETQAKVQHVLQERFPGYIDFGDGTFAVAYGSTSVSLVVRPYTETDTIVELMAHIASGSTLDRDILHWLLRKNAELHFGAFGLLFDDSIVFSYSVSGNTVNANELEAAVATVAVIADHYDDEIVTMAGGKRAID